MCDTDRFQRSALAIPSSTLDQRFLRLHDLIVTDLSLPARDRRRAHDGTLGQSLSVAAHLVAAQLIAMESFRRAMRTDTSPDGAIRMRVTAVTIVYRDLPCQAYGRAAWLDQKLAWTPVWGSEGPRVFPGVFRRQHPVSG